MPSRPACRALLLQAGRWQCLLSGPPPCRHPVCLSQARELFAAGFVSCWSELDEGMQVGGLPVPAATAAGACSSSGRCRTLHAFACAASCQPRCPPVLPSAQPNAPHFPPPLLPPFPQEQLVRSLEAALASPTIPPDIVTTLLNLAEFMEHDEKALPLDTR